MDLKRNWEKILNILQEELSDASFEAWFDPLEAISVDDNKKILHLQTDNLFIFENINDRYMPLLQNAVKTCLGDDYSVSLDVAESEPETISEEPDYTPSEEMLEEEYYFNPRFSFDSFVVGPNSEFAYYAALAVAESPARRYNPLFLYGGSGLGKTHLMHAIGHHILKNSSNTKILYVSSEMFTNELIKALQDKRIDVFKNKYRNIDVLMIDDIQFIEGKERTQEEFFHTFEALHERNKQIIISSDRPPKKLTNLDDRMTSRFMMGLPADIQPPDFETRVAILNTKAKEQNLEINEDTDAVISLIANRIKYNVRELEGAFTRIVSFAQIMHKPINESLARDVLKDILTASYENKVNIENIKKAVSQYYGINEKDMDSKKRSRNIAYPRQIAMFLSKEMTDSSLPKIGTQFGNRDHTTVLYAHNKIKDDIDSDDTLKGEIDELKQIIRDL